MTNSYMRRTEYAVSLTQSSSLRGYEKETRQEYEPLIQRLVESGKLEYVGVCDKIDDLYASCHVLIHPSYHEGLSNVCLEAAACGRELQP